MTNQPHAGYASVLAPLADLGAEDANTRCTDWAERNRAVILTALLAGLRSAERLRTNGSDARVTDSGAIIQVSGKGRKEHHVPVEPGLVEVLELYLDTRASRFPATTKRRRPYS